MKNYYLLCLCYLFLNGCVYLIPIIPLQTTSQQLGVTAFKIAVNAKCINEIHTLPAWKTATRLMTSEQRENIQTNVCGCGTVKKAPNSVTTIELATAAIDPTARATIVNQVVSETVNACVAEVLKK